MAFVPSAVWTVSYTFRDNNGKTSTAGAQFVGTLTDAQVIAAAESLGTDLQDVSDASLVGYTISRSVVQDAPVVPALSSEVERKLLVPLGTAAIANASSISVPSPVFSLESPNTDVVDTANPLMAQLITSLTLGALGAGNGITTNRGEDITRVGVPVIVHRTRRARR